MAGHAVVHQLFDDLLIDRERLRVDAHVAEDHLRASRRLRLPPCGDDVSHQRIYLRASEVRPCGEHPAVEGQLAAVGGDGQGIVLTRVHPLVAEPLVPPDKPALQLGLLLRHRAGDGLRLAAFEGRRGKVQIVRRLHVGKRPEHLNQLGQVHEFGKARPGPQRGSVRGDFHRLGDLAERGRPAVEVVDAAFRHGFRVEVPLERVHLDHGIADRRARGADEAVPGVLLVEVAGLHVEVERPLAAAGGDAGDPLHLGRRLEVLVGLELVDEDLVNPELVEHQPVVFLVAGQQVLEFLLAGGLLFLQIFDDVPAGRCLVHQQRLVFLDLLAQEPLLVFAAHADSLEAGMRHDDRVPVAGGDLGRQVFAAVLGEIVLAGRQYLCVRVNLHELAAELLQHVVGHTAHNFFC